MVGFIVNYWAVALVAGITGILIYKLRIMKKDGETQLSKNTAKKIAVLRADGRPKATELVDEENELEENYKIELRTHRFKYSALNVFFASIALIVCAYLMKFGGRPFSDEPEQWGQMGDFFGGMLNPVLAFASFMALLYTIRLQSEELRLTREELAASRIAQEDSSKALEGQLTNLQIQQFESTFFSLIGQIRMASIKSDKKDVVVNNITWPTQSAFYGVFDNEVNKLAFLSKGIFDACKSSNAIELRYLSLMTSSIVYVDENLKSDTQKRKYLSILSIYANDLESYLLYLWLASFNTDLIGERKKARDVINKYGFFRELITFSGSDSMLVASIFNAKQHNDYVKHGDPHISILQIKLSDSGYFSSCILGRPYPETILPVDISPQ